MTEYLVESRNGYHAIDEYKDGKCIRTVLSGVSKAVATQVASELSSAYHTGYEAAGEEYYQRELEQSEYQ